MPPGRARSPGEALTHASATGSPRRSGHPTPRSPRSTAAGPSAGWRAAAAPPARRAAAGTPTGRRRHHAVHAAAPAHRSGRRRRSVRSSPPPAPRLTAHCFQRHRPVAAFRAVPRAVPGAPTRLATGEPVVIPVGSPAPSPAAIPAPAVTVACVVLRHPGPPQPPEPTVVLRSHRRRSGANDPTPLQRRISVTGTPPVHDSPSSEPSRRCARRRAASTKAESRRSTARPSISRPARQESVMSVAVPFGERRVDGVSIRRGTCSPS